MRRGQRPLALLSKTAFSSVSSSPSSSSLSSLPLVLFIFRCVLASLYEVVSVGRLVGWSVGWSVMLSSKSTKNRLLRILNEVDSAGRGNKRDEEEGGTRRNEERGGRRGGQEGGTGRKEGRGE